MTASVQQLYYGSFGNAFELADSNVLVIDLGLSPCPTVVYEMQDYCGYTIRKRTVYYNSPTQE